MSIPHGYIFGSCVPHVSLELTLMISDKCKKQKIIHKLMVTRHIHEQLKSEKHYIIQLNAITFVCFLHFLTHAAGFNMHPCC